MRDFNLAWWVAVGIGVILLAIDFLVTPKAKKKIGKWLLVFGVLLVGVGLVGVGHDYFKNKQTSAQNQSPPQPPPTISQPLNQSANGAASQQQTKHIGRSIPKSHPVSTTDNSVHVEDGSKIEQQSSGDCSPNMIGGSNTVNCVPPARHLSEQQKSDLRALIIPDGIAVSLSLSGQDGDSQGLGNEIFSACNGKIPPAAFSPLAIYSGPPPKDVIVRIKNPTNPDLVSLGNKIAKIISTPAIHVVAGSNENAQPNTVEIIVGPPSP